MLIKLIKNICTGNRPARAEKTRHSGPTVNPEFGCLGITDECMLRCKMCRKWEQDIFISKNDVNRFPSVKQYRKFLYGLRELVDDEFVMNFGGGEALLFKDIFAVIKSASDAGLRTNLNSNGFLLDEKVARRLGESGLQHIKLSLDSIERETHDYMRGVEGVYDRVMRAIDNLQRFAPAVRVSLISVIYEQTYRKFIPLMEWINANDAIEHVLIMVAMQPNNTEPEERWWQGEHGFLWPKDRGAVDALLEEVIGLKERGYKIINTPGQLRAVKNYLAHPERFVKRTACNMDKAVHVSSIGQVFLCFNYGLLGDIRRGDDIRVLWFSDQARIIREKIRACKKNCHFLINCFFEEDPQANAQEPLP